MANLKMQAAVKQIKILLDRGQIPVQIHDNNYAVWAYTIGLSKIAGKEIFIAACPHPTHKDRVSHMIREVITGAINLNVAWKDKNLTTPAIMPYGLDRKFILLDIEDMETKLLDPKSHLYLFSMLNAVYPQFNDLKKPPVMQLMFSDLAGQFIWDGQPISNDFYAKCQLVLNNQKLQKMLDHLPVRDGYLAMCLKFFSEVEEVNKSLGRREKIKQGR